MMPVWNTYPENYREKEIHRILRAVSAGESVSLVGLSGSGKSNLLGFLAHCFPATPHQGHVRFFLVDCNRLETYTSSAFFELIKKTLCEITRVPDASRPLVSILEGELRNGSAPLCIILRSFDSWKRFLKVQSIITCALSATGSNISLLTWWPPANRSIRKMNWLSCFPGTPSGWDRWLKVTPAGA